jgi:phage gp36-like protein
MSYCTYTDLVERFGAKELSQLTNMNGPCPAIDGAIDDATAEIDGYLSSRYSLPITGQIPALLKRCACEMARYFLWDDNATDHVRQRYEDAIGILQGIANGTIDPPLAGNIKKTISFTGLPSVWARR